MGFMKRLNEGLVNDFNRTRKVAKRYYNKLNKNKDYIASKRFVKTSVTNTVKREMQRAKRSGGNYLTLPSDVNRMTDF